MTALALALLLASLPASPTAAPPSPQSSPQPARTGLRWEVPGLIDWVDSAGVQVSDGVPMVLQLARSKRSIGELIQHFATAFEKAGLYIPPGSEQVRAFQEPQLTALDPQRLVAYTVIFQPNPDKTTTVIFGTSSLAQYKPGSGRASLEWAPLPPGAEQLMRMDMEGSQSAVFRVSSTAREVQSFYREAMKKAGYQEREPGEFHRGAERIHVFTHAQDGQLSVGLTRNSEPSP